MFIEFVDFTHSSSANFWSIRNCACNLIYKPDIEILQVKSFNNWSRFNISYKRLYENWNIFKPVANAQILVTAGMSIKVTGIFIANSFVLQLRRHTGTHIFTSIHLMYISNDSSLCRELKKILVSNFFFRFKFIFYGYCNYKQTGTIFLGLFFKLWFTPCKAALVLIAEFRAGLVGLNLGYPENPALKPRKPS